MDNKKHVSFWIDEDDLKECDANVKFKSARSRSEYIANAVKFYNWYIHDKNNEEYVNSKVKNSLEKMMKSFENRMARQLFKQSVEICKVFWLIVKGFNLRPEDVIEFHEDCVEEVKRLSDRVVKGCHMLCKSMLQDAVKEGIIQKNPAENIKLPNLKPKKIDVLSQEEIQRFLIQAKYEGYFELFLTALMTGMRKGEVLALKWSDLNLKTGELHIQRQVKRIKGELVISTSKTNKSSRSIILPKSLLEILKEYRKTQTSDWIFASPVKENSPRDPSAVYREMQRILKRSDCHKIRFHDLRHTFATMAFDGGMDIKTLSDMIGHASASTTLNIYLHSSDKMKKDAAGKIDGIFGESNESTPENKKQPSKTIFEPQKGKRRKAGTGCIHKINDNLYEGRIYVKENGKRHVKCVYAKTKEECEIKLQNLIQEVNKN